MYEAYIVWGVLDTGASYEQIKLSIMAQDENNARKVAQEAVANGCDEHFQIEGIKKMDPSDRVISRRSL